MLMHQSDTQTYTPLFTDKTMDLKPLIKEQSKETMVFACQLLKNGHRNINHALKTKPESWRLTKASPKQCLN